MNHKSYLNIEYMKEKYSYLFKKGDYVVVQEKIDGTNVSFQYDDETDTIQCFSRNKILDSENTLRGYYDWVQKLDKELVRSVLGNNLRMFAEWLVKHTVKYPTDKYENVYCYDVYDMQNHKYLPQNEVRLLVEKLGLNYVPVFYEGEFTSWNDYFPLVGKTQLGGEIGEGIVIKNMSTLNNPDPHKPFYLKLVDEKFLEVTKRHVKNTDPEKILKKEKNMKMVESVVTNARVEKLLYKLVDEGVIPENYSTKDMSVIIKHLTSAVYYDCMKEEPQIVNLVENFGKYSGAIVIKIVKEIIQKT